MAIQTKVAASFDNDACVWSYTWEDGATGAVRRIVRVMCNNDGQYNTRGTLTVTSNGRTFSRVVAPGGSLDVAAPAQQQQRLDITVDARGRVDGIDHHFEYGPDV